MGAHAPSGWSGVIDSKSIFSFFLDDSPFFVPQVLLPIAVLRIDLKYLPGCVGLPQGGG
jgi:hypothetical protein